jgi:hypothetical protein
MTTDASPALREIAGRIDHAPSVAGRSRGLFGTAATLLPGERIDGLRVRAGRLEVHVVMTGGGTVSQVERDVLDAVGNRWECSLVDIVVEDIDLEPPQGSRER